MPLFGRFETVDELASSGPITVYAARPAGQDGQPTLAIKTFRTVDDLADPEILAARAAAFLRSANAQRSLGDLTPPVFAKVHDIGTAEAAVYMVTDLAPLTAQWLIDNRKDLSPPELGRILRAVITGIGMLGQSTVTRAHGNLRPSNILLSSRDVNDASVVLTDPTDPTAVDENSPGDDMKAIGAILFELVAHRAAPSGTAIRTGPEWARMRGIGEALRQLCEQLLNPTTGQELSPPKALERLEAALAIRESKLVRNLIIATAAAAVIGGGSFVAYKKMTPEPPPIVKTTEPDAADVRTDEFKKKLADALASANAQLNQKLSSTFEELLVPGAQAKEQFTKQYQVLLEELEAFNKRSGELPKDRVQIAADAPALEKRIAEFEPVILDKVARMRAIASAAKFEESAAKLGASRVKRMRELAATMTDAAGKADATSILGEFDAALAEAGKIREAAASSPDAASGDASGGAALLAKAEALATTLSSLEQRGKTWSGKFDAASIALESAIDDDERNFDAGNTDETDPVAKVNKRFFAYIRNEYLGTSSPTIEEYRKHAAVITAWTSAVRGLKNVEGPSPQATLLVPADKARALAVADAQIRIEELANSNNTQKAIGKLVEENQGASNAQISKAKGEITAFATGLYTALSTAAGVRDRIASGVLFKEDANGATIESLRNTLRDDPLRKTIDLLATPAGDPTEKQRNAAKLFAPLAAEIKSLLSAADAVEAVAASTSTDALRTMIAEEGNLSRSVSAWSRLLTLGYPATPEQFEDLAAIQQRLSKRLDSVAEAAQAQRLKTSLIASLRTAWFDLVNTKLSSDPAPVSRAMNAANIGTLGLGAEDVVKGLRPHAHVNWLRLELINEIEKAQPRISALDKDSLTRELKQLLDAGFGRMEALPGYSDIAATPEHSALLAKLRRAREGKAGADLAKSGPGLRNWAMNQRDDEGNVVTYSAATAKGKTTLEFVKLPTSTDDFSYYLCTTELSIAAFLDALDMIQQRPGGGKKYPINDLMFSEIAETRNPRVGPRSWRYLADGAIKFTAPTENNKPNVSQGWYTTEIPAMSEMNPFYAAGITVQNSSERMPMNTLRLDAAAYVAAAAGCRFPTPSEMKSVMSAGEPADSNRRDQTFALQFEHISQMIVTKQVQARNQPLMLPDAGMFVTAAEASAKPQDGSAAVNRNDQILWFSEVNTGSQTSMQGTQVFHVFGNVAEFVCEKPELFSPAASPAQVAAAVREAGTSVAVMGGSALSPARYAPDTALVGNWKTDGFSDVGVRLAFTAEGGSAAAGGSLAKAIKDLSEMKFVPAPAANR